jgi:transcription initiation factor TFIIB
MGNRFVRSDKLPQPCCDSPQVIISNECEYVCANCGLVLQQIYTNSERRAYNVSEINTRRRCEPLWRSFGNRTIIGSQAFDARGKYIHPQKRALFARLTKIQGSLINSIERNYWEARPKLNAIALALGLPDYILETAWVIYRAAVKKHLTQGRSIEGFISASLYVAIRIHDFPRLLEEIAEHSTLSMRKVHKCIGLLVRYVLPELELRYRPLSSKFLIYRFGNELDLSMPTQQGAHHLLDNALKLGMSNIGKDPKGIAAAVLYLAARNTDERCTQTRIAQIAHITEVTLRTRIRQIHEYAQKESLLLCRASEELL